MQPLDLESSMNEWLSCEPFLHPIVSAKHLCSEYLSARVSCTYVSTCACVCVRVYICMYVCTVLSLNSLSCLLFCCARFLCLVIDDNRLCLIESFEPVHNNWPQIFTDTCIHTYIHTYMHIYTYIHTLGSAKSMCWVDSEATHLSSNMASYKSNWSKYGGWFTLKNTSLTYIHTYIHTHMRTKGNKNGDQAYFHLVTYLLTHSLTCLLIYSLTCLLIYSLT